MTIPIIQPLPANGDSYKVLVLLHNSFKSSNFKQKKRTILLAVPQKRFN